MASVTSEKLAKKRAPKQGQIERTITQVMDAAIDLLSEVGYRKLTFELVAQRSGVARSTIYRHWNSMPELAIEAFDEALGPPTELPDTGNLRDDLVTSFGRLAHLLRRSIWGRALPALIEATHNDPAFEGLLPKLVARRRAQTRKLFERAIERGEIPTDAPVEWILDLLSGLLYHRLLITALPLEEEGLVPWAVDRALSGLALAER